MAPHHPAPSTTPRIQRAECKTALLCGADPASRDPFRGFTQLCVGARQTAVVGVEAVVGAAQARTQCDGGLLGQRPKHTHGRACGDRLQGPAQRVGLRSRSGIALERRHEGARGGPSGSPVEEGFQVRPVDGALGREGADQKRAIRIVIGAQEGLVRFLEGGLLRGVRGLFGERPVLVLDAQGVEPLHEKLLATLEASHQMDLRSCRR